MAEVCDKYFARAVDNSVSCQYNQELQVIASPEKERKYAVFVNVNAHQDPDHLDVPPAPLWILKLPNSLKSGIWSVDEFGSCPAGPGKTSRRIIHNILQIIIDFYEDSCYKVIRNRVSPPNSFLCFLF